MTKVRRIDLDENSNPAKEIETLCKNMWDVDRFRLAATFAVTNRLFLVFQKLD